MDALALVESPALAAETPQLQLSQLMAALSHALDLTEGQPKGHCVRCCWIGMHLGHRLGLDEQALWNLYYTLLLKDLGCSSNAARICELYLADDLGFKRDFKQVGDSLPSVLRFVFSHTGAGADFRARLRHTLHILRNGSEVAQELIVTRCQRGSAIARRLRFPDAVARAIECLDEHWDGGGRPERLAGEAIPLAARIALLAQVADVFHSAAGRDAALHELRTRAGRWFDPRLVAAFERVAEDERLWQMLRSPMIDAAVLALEPGHGQVPLDDDFLDDIAAAFGQVVDAKSPYTAGHSARVGELVDAIAATLGLPAERRRWLRRGALLHDVGKLGVSNAVLDKPGKLDAAEWIAVRRHAEYTEQILSRISAFDELARIAGAHHERLDGAGYPRGLTGSAIALETRIITAADIFDAISAERPYRGATPAERTLQIMAESLGSAIDPRCYEALRAVVQGDSQPARATSTLPPSPATG
jgi:HD-GYP domain-containing protein (c-di-GMP phosphodiesterase class II)